MSSYTTRREAILGAASGDNIWAALAVLPKVPTLLGAQEAHELDDWPDAGFGDLVLASEYCKALLHALVQDSQPPPMPGEDHDFLVRLGYRGAESVPVLMVCDMIRGACAQLVMRACRLHEQSLSTGTDPDDGDLPEFMPRMRAWADMKWIESLRTRSVPGHKRVAALKAVLQVQGSQAAWLYIRTAMERWPSQISPSDAHTHLIGLFARSVGVARLPSLHLLTEPEVWTSLHQKAGQFARPWADIQRDDALKGHPQLGSMHLAILDPTFALSSSFAALVAAQVNSFLGAETERDRQRAVDAWKRVRDRDSQPDAELLEARGLSDFVVPQAGDDVWPGSVLEVSSMVEVFLHKHKEALDQMGFASTVILEFADRPFLLILPTSLPIGMLETDEEHHHFAHARHRLVTMDQAWANHDMAVQQLLTASTSQTAAKELRDVLEAVQSITIPPLLSSGAVLLLFPDVDPRLAAAISSSLYPLFKLLKEAASKRSGSAPGTSGTH
jgi:hypothetical protein